MDRLLHPGEIKKIFGVSNRTLRAWADAGKLRSVRTLGGHRRYFASDIEAIAAIMRKNLVTKP
jgi:excisionase family DNA binding protein